MAGFRLFEPPTAPSRLELVSTSGSGFEIDSVISGGFVVIVGVVAGDIGSFGDIAVFGDIVGLCRSGVLGFEGGPIVSTGVISTGSSSSSGEMSSTEMTFEKLTFKQDRFEWTRVSP